jgi:lipoprotein-anchoring transpeptidase ErfK/SrfK
MRIRFGLPLCAAMTVMLIGTHGAAMPALDPASVATAGNASDKQGKVIKAAHQPVTANPSPVQSAPSLTARIDLTAQRLTVLSGGATLYEWKISSGRSGHETPPGSFRPKWMAKTWHSRKYNMAPMPYSVFFNGGIATHGTTAVGRLGRPASHGCIRLKTANARIFYNLVRKHGMANTRIIVTGRAPQVPYNVASVAVPQEQPVVTRSSQQRRWRQQSFGLPQVGFNISIAD